MVEIHLVILFMIAAAIIAAQVKDLLSSVIAVGAVGIGLCMAFLLLKAPDLAITQLVIEILSLIILIRATIKMDLPFSTSGRWMFNTASTVIFIFVFIGFAFVSLKCISQFGMPIMRVSKGYLQEGLARTGAFNLIGAITMDFRVLDTLGEAVVLFTAIIGVLAVARRTGRSEAGKR